MAKVMCPVCYGGKTVVTTCSVCFGTGRTQRDPMFRDDVKSYEGTVTVGSCIRCDGTGHVRSRCPTCKGQGSLDRVVVGAH